jgi:hypothetical protein
MKTVVHFDGPAVSRSICGVSYFHDCSPLAIGVVIRSISLGRTLAISVSYLLLPLSLLLTEALIWMLSTWSLAWHQKSGLDIPDLRVGFRPEFLVHQSSCPIRSNLGIAQAVADRMIMHSGELGRRWSGAWFTLDLDITRSISS